MDALRAGRRDDRGVLAELGPERVAQLRELCRAALPPPPFTIDARAWAVRGRA